VSEVKYHSSEGNSPEAILEFLSDHRQGVERRRRPRGLASGSSTTILLGLVAAVALAGGSVLVWKHFTHPQSVSLQAVHSTAHGTGAATPRKRTISTAKERSQATAAAKAHAPAAPAAPRPGAAPWNSGLQPWGHSTARRLPNFYYAWVTSHVSCAGYTEDGCWKLHVATRHGCPGGVMAVAQEMYGSSDEGATWGFSRRVAARARAVVELDADKKSVRAQLDSLSCRPRS
jgi:hypothetical protein